MHIAYSPLISAKCINFPLIFVNILLLNLRFFASPLFWPCFKRTWCPFSHALKQSIILAYHTKSFSKSIHHSKKFNVNANHGLQSVVYSIFFLCIDELFIWRIYCGENFFEQKILRDKNDAVKFYIYRLRSRGAKLSNWSDSKRRRIRSSLHS